ncbi:molybdenum cofactor biosynthesis protein MoaA [alpha proteobacterium U9-1i]|nr:molybdenum cofactor biosynthesis protein MoaA [alpha proteobacterium U9-1i]
MASAPAHSPRTTGPAPAPAGLTDGFGRRISYLRVSVTDRCDLRCTYCMPERAHFLPKAEVLSLEELERLCGVFVRTGVRKLRLTGGEPLVRRDAMTLVRGLSRHLHDGALDELTLTTNGTQLRTYATQLFDAGIRRINVSLDTLDRDTFFRITRRDQLHTVLGGIEAAQAAGLRVKLNTVALKHDNLRELPTIVAWAHERGMDISLIETMPLGEVDQDRVDQYVSLDAVRATLSSFWTLTDVSDSTGGPSRYCRIRETGGRLGFITPLSNTFCDVCNRVRLTCTGRLYLCLGQDDHVDFREPLRAGAKDAELAAILTSALQAKPEAHSFRIAERGAAPAVTRHMSMTGG